MVNGRGLTAVALCATLSYGAAEAAIVSGFASYGVEVTSITGPDPDNDLDFFLDAGPGESTFRTGQATAMAKAETTGFDFPASPFVSSAEMAISATPTSTPSYAEALANNSIFFIIFNLSEVNSYGLSLKFSYEYGIAGSAPFADFGTSIGSGSLGDSGACGVDFDFSYDTADAPFSEGASGGCSFDIALGPATPTTPSLFSFQADMAIYGETFEAAIPLPAGVFPLAGALAALAGLGLHRRRRSLG